MAERIREPMDPSGYAFSPLPEGERRHFTQMMKLGAQSPEHALPDLPADEPVLDPAKAVVALGLAAMPGTTAGAQIELIECGDYDCPYCRQSEPLLDELRERYGDALSIHWLHNPLPMHDTALPAARAAVAAENQGAFWAYHHALMGRTGPHDRPVLLEVAQAAGLDLERFETDLDDPASARAVARQARVCQAAGAQSTPSFFVDGDLVVGARSFDALTVVSDEALAE